MKRSVVKIGDELAIYHRQRGPMLLCVDRITDSGQIRCGRVRLTPGLRVIGKLINDFCYVATPVTPEIRGEALRNDSLRKIADCDFSKLETPSLISICGTIEKAGQ
jgi:hypothetical protein